MTRGHRAMERKVNADKALHVVLQDNRPPSYRAQQ